MDRGYHFRTTIFHLLPFLLLPPQPGLLSVAVKHSDWQRFSIVARTRKTGLERVCLIYPSNDERVVIFGGQDPRLRSRLFPQEG